MGSGDIRSENRDPPVMPGGARGSPAMPGDNKIELRSRT
jgi:hypothetical protein